MSEAGVPGTRGFRVTGWGAGACCRNPEQSEGPASAEDFGELVDLVGIELEAISRRERSRGGEREPAAEIPSRARDLRSTSCQRIWWTWSGSNRRPPRLCRGALSFPVSRLLAPELSDETSSSSTVARAAVPLMGYRTILDKRTSMDHDRVSISSARVDAQLGGVGGHQHSLCGTSLCFDSAECKRLAYTIESFGGPGRDRTDDLFHAMEARSQLRHRPTLGDTYPPGSLEPKKYCRACKIARQCGDYLFHFHK